jgi:hypothetical protein
VERTTENAQMCLGMVEDFKILSRDQPRDPAIFERACEFLVNTLLDACKSPNSAQIVAREIMANEDRFPVPATIRRYLRQNDLVEADVSERQIKAAREECSRRAAERENAPKPCTPEVGRRIDRIVWGLDAEVVDEFRREMHECQNDDSKEMAVIERYESLLPPKN